MESFLVDSHCHLDRLDLKAWEDGLDGALRDARDNHVQHFLCVSINLEDYPLMRQLADPFAQVFFSVGVHPNETDCHEPGLEELLQLADDSRVVAIGETGLDYFRSEGDLRWQQDRFRLHIEAAKQCGKPLIIHNRDAKDDTIKILAEQNAAEVGGVMHCFVEDWETAQKAMDLNFYISFSGIVTFKSALELKQVAKNMPMDRILIETDSPYLAPVPYRGKINQPAYVKHVAECIADLKQLSFEEVAAQTSNNFFRLFSHAKSV